MLQDRDDLYRKYMKSICGYVEEILSKDLSQEDDEESRAAKITAMTKAIVHFTATFFAALSLDDKHYVDLLEIIYKAINKYKKTEYVVMDLEEIVRTILTQKD